MACRTAVASLIGSPPVRSTRSCGTIQLSFACQYGKLISAFTGWSSPICRTSRFTPTIVNHGDLSSASPSLNRFPMGSSSGQNWRAIVSLMMATGGDFKPSCSSNMRPRVIAILMVSM